MGKKDNDTTPPEGEDSGEGIESTPKIKAPSPPNRPTAADDRISQANAAAARMEAANERFTELLAKQEALQVEQTLGGTAQAGNTGTQKEDSDVDYAKKVMANDIETTN